VAHDVRQRRDPQLALDPIGLSVPQSGYVRVWIVLSYLWLPYMILPIYAGLERIPNSLLDASGDLGARPWRTFRAVVLPCACPAIAAGSIFTFSLSLGDYITPQLVSSTQFIGNVVYANVGIANNLPLAAAFATVPVLIMIVYLLLVRGPERSRRSDAVSTSHRAGCCGSRRAHARVPVRAAARDRDLRVQHDRVQRWPPDGLTLSWFRQGDREHRARATRCGRRSGRRSARR
jgi:ABC-type Fe3+ transport system permease subunit